MCSPDVSGLINKGHSFLFSKSLNSIVDDLECVCVCVCVVTRLSVCEYAPVFCFVLVCFFNLTACTVFLHFL